jgi:protein-tyrosine phosphatase
MENLFNVRDLGGYPVGDGGFNEKRQVKRGLLYRAGDLGAPSERDRALLEDRNIRIIMDFRSEKEIQRLPDCEFKTVKHYRALSIDAGNMLELSRIERGIDGESLMEELYRGLAAEARSQYREFFEILADADSAPLLFHCSAGKDRTGFAAALILSALGVDRELIYQDYLLSAKYLTDKYQALLEAEPYLEPVMSVRRSYLEVAFTRIDTDFGGMDRYLGTELGADIKRLRELYTERAEEK